MPDRRFCAKLSKVGARGGGKQPGCDRERVCVRIPTIEVRRYECGASEGSAKGGRGGVEFVLSEKLSRVFQFLMQEGRLRGGWGSHAATVAPNGRGGSGWYSSGRGSFVD